jgi:hypothetical protein
VEVSPNVKRDFLHAPAFWVRRCFGIYWSFISILLNNNVQEEGSKENERASGDRSGDRSGEGVGRGTKPLL